MRAPNVVQPQANILEVRVNELCRRGAGLERRQLTVGRWAHSTCAQGRLLDVSQFA
jgi:hypothetical protein